VSLTLDMSSLGNVEPFVAIPTPREKVAMEYLQSASRILTRSQLRDVVASSHLLQSEFMVSLLFVICFQYHMEMTQPYTQVAYNPQMVTVQKVKCNGFRSPSVMTTVH
jgi:hypothetical protein